MLSTRFFQHLLAAAVLCGLSLPTARAQTRLFVVGTFQPQGPIDGYVLPLSNPKDIADARAQLPTVFGDGKGKIVFARIVPSSDGFNRDYLTPGAPARPWKVTEFLGFSPYKLVGSDYGDYPEAVDEDVSGWIAKNGDVISFLYWRVAGELPVQPEVDLGAGGWKFSPWFGLYNDAYYPWLYRLDEGWFYVFGLDPQNVWFYSPERGYEWSSETVYPWVYSLQTQSWSQRGLGDNDVVGEGTVRFNAFEGGFYAINGDDGRAYDPIPGELAPDFQQDGLRVRFHVRERPRSYGIHMVGPIVDVITIQKL